MTRHAAGGLAFDVFGGLFTKLNPFGENRY